MSDKFTLSVHGWENAVLFQTTGRTQRAVFRDKGIAYQMTLNWPIIDQWRKVHHIIACGIKKRCEKPCLMQLFAGITRNCNCRSEINVPPFSIFPVYSHKKRFDHSGPLIPRHRHNWNGHRDQLEKETGI